MNDALWESMAEGLIERAQRVKCSVTEYTEGLKQMIHALEDERQAAFEMQEQVGGDDAEG